MVFLILPKYLAVIMHFSMYSYPVTSDVHWFRCFYEISTLWNSFFFFVLNKALGKKKWWICLSQLMRKCRIFLVALCLEKWTLSAKTDAQFERCELSFIWGKMRTAAQETAPQITQKLLQRDSGGRSVCDFGEGGVECNQALTLQKVFCQEKPEEQKSSFSGLVFF